MPASIEEFNKAKCMDGARCRAKKKHLALLLSKLQASRYGPRLHTKQKFVRKLLKQL